MPGTSLATAQAQLDAANNALTALLAGHIQSYTMPDGRTVTHKNEQDLLNLIHALEIKVQRLSRGGLDVKRIVFI